MKMARTYQRVFFGVVRYTMASETFFATKETEKATVNLLKLQKLKVGRFKY